MAIFSTTYVSSDSFTITGDVTAYFPENAAIRVNCGGTWVYSIVSSSVYSSPNTTITVKTTDITAPATVAEVSTVHPFGIPNHDHSDVYTGGSDVLGSPPDHEYTNNKIRFKEKTGWGSYNLIGFSWKADWVTSTSYYENDLVIDGYSIFICASDHTSDSTSRPKTGTYWEDYWELFSRNIAWRDDWVTDTNYYIGDAISYEGSSYICIDDHTSDSTTIPDYGTYWEDYWAYLSTGISWKSAWLTSTIYLKRSLVFNGYSTYICLVSHLSDATTEPGAGVYESTYWDTVASTPSSPVSPDYSPPSMIYKDADEIYIPVGRYFKGGHRVRGQYQDTAGLATYWDVNTQLAVDIDGAYSDGASSGIVGGKVNSSWYSVFMVGNDANSIMLLPWVYNKKSTYSAPNTIINPKGHLDSFGIAGLFNTSTATTDWTNYSLRINTNATTMAVTGTRARVWLVCPTNTTTTIDNVGIGQRANMGYGCDTTATPVEVTFNGGQSGVTLTQSAGIVISDWVDVSIASGQQAVVILDISGSGTNYHSNTTSVSTEYWYKTATNSYNVQNPAGFNSGSAGMFVMAVELGSDDNSYIASNDIWNNYRLVKNKIEDPVTDGKIFTISDTVDDSSDQILISGDQTSLISYGDWFQLIPPVDIPCVYLGTIRLDASGNLLRFKKDRWRYSFAAQRSVVGNIRISNPSLTGLIYGAPPSAEKILMNGNVNSAATGASYVDVRLYDVTGTNVVQTINRNGGNAAYTQICSPFSWDMNLTGKIYNMFYMYTGSWTMATSGTLDIFGFEE